MRVACPRGSDIYLKMHDENIEAQEALNEKINYIIASFGFLNGRIVELSKVNNITAENTLPKIKEISDQSDTIRALSPTSLDFK